MTLPLWAWTATDLAAGIRAGTVSCLDVVEAALTRIDQLNPRLNAVVHICADEARGAAIEADWAVREGAELGPLHGVPVTVKVNIDQKGWPTTDGVEAFAANIAEEDSPPAASLKRAGAIIVGRTNTPAFSLRWFTANDLHGRTFNPWDASVTPGGSSGGAAVAAATGMGAIAHGNDYGGSVRYPAYACGVVGLRASTGRIASFNATAKAGRGITLQQMSVQGPLTRTVADARLALAAMSARDARDPLWTAAPPAAPAPRRAALFKRAANAGPAVVAALDAAANWLAAAGYAVEEADPPHFDEAADLWRMLVYNDLRRAAVPLIETHGDEAVKINIRHILETTTPVSLEGYLEGQARRYAIAQAWSLFFDKYPVLLMPVSWKPPAPVDEDIASGARLEALIAAQSPLLATALLGLPGLSVPTGLHNGVPMGVQLAAWRMGEDLCLDAGEVIERAARFAHAHLT